MKKITKEELQQLYVEQGKNIKELAEIFECSVATIRNYIKKFQLIKEEIEEVVSDIKEDTDLKENIEEAHGLLKTIWEAIKSFFGKIF